MIFNKIKKEIDLRLKKELTPKPQPRLKSNLAKSESTKSKTIIEKPEILSEEEYWEELIAKLPQRPDFPLKYEFAAFSKSAILKEVERALIEPVDVAAELASVGGKVHGAPPSKPRVNLIENNLIDNYNSIGVISDNIGSLENFWAPTDSGPEPEKYISADLVVDTHRHSPASREIEIWLETVRRNQELLMPKRDNFKQKPKINFRLKPKWFSWFRFNRRATIYFLAIVLSGMATWGLVEQGGLSARNNIVQNGSNAVANLEEAKLELENFNFLNAADSFALAYDDLTKASGTLNHLGASVLSIFGAIPGFSKVREANNIVEAGQSLSKSGENLALAFGTLYKTNLLSFLDSKSGDTKNSPSISRLLTEFRDILKFADKNIDRADRLLADIDTSVIPLDKQELFLDFKSKIPDFQKYIGEAVDYSDFLLKLVGSDGAKTYLVLLQNNSELRPTGGFPGSYALITFENGTLKNIFVDDIYRADAGLKDNIIPPIPLQHITPSWGMRDAGWFADFPLSARKVIEMYRLGGGLKVDGVLTITPDVIARIFEIIGPIEMPEYGVTLDANNFLAEIQNEVEYEADRAAPKRILSDLQPKFFERLAQQDKDGWVKIFKIMSEATEQKHILAYFENNDLESMAIKNELGGEIRQSSGDYLQAAFANVKGSKTDFVTDNSMSLEGEFNSEGRVEHTLKISRIHNGGNSQYGFYNRDNSAYIKVYVPVGSKLESIQGYSITDFRSLIGHEDFGFRKDPDLEKIESGITRPFAGVDVFEESGKTVFGFWLITKPGQSKSVTLKYQVPLSAGDGKYSLLWQKQSGTDKDQISFSLKIPENKNVINQSANLQVIGDSLVLNSDLSEDRNIDVDFK